jgi:hypothetical protein
VSPQLKRFRDQHRSQPAPLQECLDLQAWASESTDTPNPLSPPTIEHKGIQLQDRELAQRLADETFGGWSPEIEALDWLVDLISRERPRTFLEFGSGRTTVCWCVVLNRIYGPTGFRILSLDQDAENVERATKRLEGLEGRTACRIVHAPLKPTMVNDKATSVYDIDQVDPALFAWLGKAEFVFVDGPYAKGPCRYGALPKVRPHLASGARVVLDDALRGEELRAASLWSQDGFLIEGLITLGQGIMLGKVP